MAGYGGSLASRDRPRGSPTGIPTRFSHEKVGMRGRPKLIFFNGIADGMGGWGGCVIVYWWFGIGSGGILVVK